MRRLTVLTAVLLLACCTGCGWLSRLVGLPTPGEKLTTGSYVIRWRVPDHRIDLTTWAQVSVLGDDFVLNTVSPNGRRIEIVGTMGWGSISSERILVTQGASSGIGGFEGKILTPHTAQGTFRFFVVGARPGAGTWRLGPP